MTKKQLFLDLTINLWWQIKSNQVSRIFSTVFWITTSQDILATPPAVPWLMERCTFIHIRNDIGNELGITSCLHRGELTYAQCGCDHFDVGPWLLHVGLLFEICEHVEKEPLTYSIQQNGKTIRKCGKWKY